MGVPILGGWGGGPDNGGKIPTFYRFLFWRASLSRQFTKKKCILSDTLTYISIMSGVSGSTFPTKSMWQVWR